MSSHVPFQLVCVPAGITAQAALERTLPSMRANVTFQFADFYTGVIAHGTLKWLLMGVFITTMPHQFSTSHKGHVTVWALVRTSTCVCVKVIPQEGDCSECPATEMALVWSLISVTFHVTIQI